MVGILPLVTICCLTPARALGTTHIQVQTAEEDMAGETKNKTLTLAESIRYGLEHNPRIQAAHFAVQKAAADIGVARSEFLPSLSMSLDYTDLNSITASGPTDIDYIDQDIGLGTFQAVQTLFAGLTVINSYQKAKLGRELSKAQKAQEEMRLILDIQTHFLQYLKAREDVRSLEDKVRRLKVNVKVARSFVEQRMVPYVHVLQAEVDLADARQEFIKAQNTLRTQRVQLNMFLNLPYSIQTVYQGDLKRMSYDFSKMVDTCLERAFENRPEIQVAQKSLAMAAKEVDIAFGQFSPKLQVKSNYYIRDRDYGNPGVDMFGNSYDRDQKNRYWSVGVQVQWPFFEGGRKYYQYTKAKQEVSRLEQQLISTKNQIRTQVRTSYMTMLNAAERIDATQKAIQEAKEGYKRSNKRYLTKLGGLPELLDAQIRLTRAERNHTQALADYQLSLANLYYAMGIRNLSLQDQ